jgi:hypothetical protein
MSPAVGQSIVKIAPTQWLIGSSMICESGLKVPPETMVARWIGNEGLTYYLSKSSTLHDLGLSEESKSELSRNDRVHLGGTGAAVWAFGNVHVKAKAWTPESQLEHETIKHVRKINVNIPMPDVVFS